MAIVNSEWVNSPTHAGAYWMRNNELETFRICQVVTHIENEVLILVPGYEGALPTEQLKLGELSFFGPLSLPEGSAHIFANAVYKKIDLPIGPTGDENEVAIDPC